VEEKIQNWLTVNEVIAKVRHHACLKHSVLPARHPVSSVITSVSRSVNQ